jgi:hypothetical protein
MNVYCKETEKPFGYLLVDNKPDTPADKQFLGDLFGDCHVYLFATQTKVNSTSVEPTPVSDFEPSLEGNNRNLHIIGIYYLVGCNYPRVAKLHLGSTGGP